MKRFALALAVGLLAGCFSSSYQYGRDFDAGIAREIEKGKTPARYILERIGEPMLKTPLSATEEKWIYQKTKGNTQVGFMGTSATGSQATKTLDLFIKDGIVQNFTFTDAPEETIFKTRS
jgi:hypothetical protein